MTNDFLTKYFNQLYWVAGGGAPGLVEKGITFLASELEDVAASANTFSGLGFPGVSCLAFPSAFRLVSSCCLPRAPKGTLSRYHLFQGSLKKDLGGICIVVS